MQFLPAVFPAFIMTPFPTNVPSPTIAYFQTWAELGIFTVGVSKPIAFTLSYKCFVWSSRFTFPSVINAYFTPALNNSSS